MVSIDSTTLSEMGLNVSVKGNKMIITSNIAGIISPITFSIGSHKGKIGKKSFRFDVPSRHDHGKILVPIRIIAEKAGFNISWDSETRQVRIMQATAPA
jgi:hypothetical protein